METKRRISKNIKNLYLDPNNYRFQDNPNYKRINENDILSESVQKRTYNFILGKNNSNINDLVASYKANGFLNIDAIQVREVENNKYVVVEGNRRVATLIHMKEQHELGYDIGILDPEIFKSIPFDIIDTEEHDSLIIMGLKHISGNKKWPAINQAKLIYDYLYDYWDNKLVYASKETELCESLGITKVKLRTMQRAYHLINAYKLSDYGDQFASAQYSIFEEIAKSPSIKKWLNWDDTQYKSLNIYNQERLFSWISTVEESEVFEEVVVFTEEEILRDPIITKAFEIRDLSRFIDNDNSLLKMEKTKSIASALIESGVKESEEIKKYIDDLQNSHRGLTSYFKELSIEEIDLINKTLKQFPILGKNEGLTIFQSKPEMLVNDSNCSHYECIEIQKFKMFDSFKIDNLNRINIFAGSNNSGKTSILEGIYLLTGLNDFDKSLSIIRARNKTTKVYSEMVTQYVQDISILGIFNKSRVSLQVERSIDFKVDKLDDYLYTLKYLAQVEESAIESKNHIYRFNEITREYSFINNLCEIEYSTPYHSSKETINKYYKKAKLMRMGKKSALDFLLVFINEMEKSIVDIFPLDEDTETDFMARLDSDKYTVVPLSSFGSGISRVFEIGLGIICSRNGVYIVDEVETAIHYSLLEKFTKFISDMSKELNVQIFVTTHSKECVDAWIGHKDVVKHLSAYFIQNDDNQIIEYIGGEHLSDLVKLLNLDIRGEK